MPSLKTLGWNERYGAEFALHSREGLVPGRVTAENRTNRLVAYEGGELIAELSGRLLHEAQSPSDLPKVGDWVALEIRDQGARGTIRAVLDRLTRFSRKFSGESTGEQVIAANADILFIVQGLDRDFNLRRLERYLVMAYDSGASPAVVLNKADLRPDWEVAAVEAEEVAPGVPVIAASAHTGQGLDRIRELLGEGIAAVFIGSSGVGKSTLVNALMGREVMETREVRLDDSRGRHTTTRRELVILPDGGLIIDTPGMREFGILDMGDGMDREFHDIADLAGTCRYSDCTHTAEPGCAVLEALENGDLPRDRYEGWLKLSRELKYLEAKRGPAWEREKKGKEIARLSKEFYRTEKKRK